MNAERRAKGLYWDRLWWVNNGCNHASPGCDHCWGPGIAERIGRGVSDGIVELDKDAMRLPGKIKRPTVFLMMWDPLHPDMRHCDIRTILGAMYEERQHTYLFLTKRAERLELLRRFHVASLADAIPGLCLGVTVESHDYIERARILCEIPAAVRFLSLEPLLGPVDLDESCSLNVCWKAEIACVIVGCESGRNARETKLDWVRDIRDQCQAAGVMLFVKQLQVNGKLVKRIEEFPEDLRIRELPWDKEGGEG